MKVKLLQKEWLLWQEHKYAAAEFEIPDEIMVEYRTLLARLGELDDYFGKVIWDQYQAGNGPSPFIERQVMPQVASIPISPEQRAKAKARSNELMKQYYMPLMLGDPPRVLATQEFIDSITKPEPEDEADE